MTAEIEANLSDAADGAMAELIDVIRVRIAATGGESEVIEQDDDSLTLEIASDKPKEFLTQLIEVTDVSFRQPLRNERLEVVCLSDDGEEFAVLPNSVFDGVDEDGQKLIGCTSASLESGEMQWESPALTSAMIESAKLAEDELQGELIEITFDGEGSALFETITADTTGYRLGVFLGDDLVFAPTVVSAIAGGTTVMTGLDSETRSLVNAVIAGGDLPVPVNVTSIEFK